MTTVANMASQIEQAVARVGPDTFLSRFTENELLALNYDWRLWARPTQIAPPGDWITWLVMAGRGFGKTRLAAEWIRERVESKQTRRMALVGRAPDDVRYTMIEGESGLLSVFPADKKPDYEPSKGQITFHTGAIGHVYSSGNPDSLRGPQHDTAWCDELASFKTAETWDNLQLGLRLGTPRQVATTTPRPVSTLRNLAQDESGNVVITRGRTFDNKANLPPAFLQQVIARYRGTRLGQQELEGLLMEDVPGALWQRSNIRYVGADGCPAMLPELRRVIIAVDPSIGDGEDQAECGIVIVAEGVDGNFYVLDDRSLRASPNRWGEEIISAYRERLTDRIVAEENQGGKMVELILRTLDPDIPYKGVYASVGKEARAEPVAALYEQKRVFHVRPFVDLEDQLCTWVPGEGESPDRLDALVWGLTELALKREWTVI